MKRRKMKKKFHRVLCTFMAVIFVMSDIVPAVSAQGTGAVSADTKQVIGFESVNPVEYYELEYGGPYEELEIPDKIRVVTELPEDIRLSAFEEGEAPEQQDELLPKYEYSHTVDKLMLETANEASSSDNTSSQVTEEAASQAAEDAGASSESAEVSAEEAGASGGSVEVSAEEAQVLLEESSKISHNDAQVYSFTDDMGKAHYRVYGSVNGQEPCWWAVDKEGTVLGVVEELDANWDFSKLDSTVAGEYQVKVQLPENYILNQGVELAYIQIMVAQENGEQVSSDNKDGSLPSVLPVSYIAARSAANDTQATYPVTIQKEGSTKTESLTFAGGDITKDSVPAIANYFFIENKDNTGKVTSNGASLKVTIDGVAQTYNNVTAMYPVTQDDGSTIWFYTTILSDGKVAWQVPSGAELIFRYEPDSDANVFTRVTIESDDWKDGSATGYYGDDNSKKNYTALVPAGEEVSITVDLPSLYSAYKDNIQYTNINAADVTQTNTKVQITAEWGPSNLRNKWINDTVTFIFTAPTLSEDKASEGVKINLRFLSYMREFYNNEGDSTAQSTTETLWLRINQAYPTLSPDPGLGKDAGWKGQRAIRIFEHPGRVEFRYNSNSTPNNVQDDWIEYEQNQGTGTYLRASKTAYQNLGPDALMSDMNVANSNWKNMWNEAGPSNNAQTYWSTLDPSVDDSKNDMQTGAYMMQIMDGSVKRVSKEISADDNDERTVFFVYQNSLKNMMPTFDGTWNPMSLSGQDLPIGVMLYTQNHTTGIFVPLESKLSMTDANASGNHEVMADIEIAGMNIKVTRERYYISDYNTNLQSSRYPGREKAKVRNWIYTVQVQGATGYLGADFITSIDTQNNVSLMSVSSNVEKVELLATQGGDPLGGPLVWQTVDSGKSMYVYQLGNSQGGAGQDSSTFNDFYDGAWGTSYSNREGALPIRIKQKDGYGIPYLKFVDSSVNDPKKLIAGITDTNIQSNTGSSKVTTTQINDQSNKTVRGRIQNLNGKTSSSLDGEVVEYLFGFTENGSWQGWGKSVKFTIEADARILAVNYSLNGGTVTGGSIPTTTTTWGSGYYITTPSTYPTPPGNQSYFVGWKIKLADGSYLKDADGKTIYLQPNQTINTTDERYFPSNRLKVGHGEDYGKSGYYNAVVVNLEAAYSETIPDGGMIEGKIKTSTQNKAGVGSQEADYSTSYTEQKGEESSGTAPYKGYYYVNMPETYESNGVKYLLNKGLSITSGVADPQDPANFVLANGRYDKAVTVTYDVGDDLPQNAQPTAPTDSNQYTTVSGHQNSITLQKPTGTYDADDFNGWTLEYTGGSISIPKEITTLVLDGNQSGNSTVGTTMTIGGSAAQAIYTSGKVNLTAVWSTLLPIASTRGENNVADVWNDQYKHSTVHEYYSGTEIKLEAKFKYDFSTKDLILAQWGANGSERTDSKAPEAMAQYLDWSLYGISIGDTADQNTKQVWSLRGSNENGLSGVKTKLELGETDDDSDGYAIATITITIPSDQVTYEKLKNQVFYLFAWNEASNSQLGKSYTSTTSVDAESSPFAYIEANAPHNDYGAHTDADYAYNSYAVANEYWFYEQMVPRGITTTNDDKAVVTGSEIQWKNVNANTQTFEVEFKYDTSIPWNVQSKKYDSAEENDANAIRVVLAKKVGNQAWEELQRFNPDGSFGDGGDLDNYDIELVAPASGSDTFKVKVTAKNSIMAASGDNDNTEFKVIAYNFQNGENSAPDANSKITMENIVGDLGDNSSIIGTKAPAVQRSVKIYPKGVKIVDTANNSEVLNQSVNVSKDYWQPSAKQTAVFTFDNAGYPDNYQSNTDFKNRFDPRVYAGNYHIALYKQKSDGSWTCVETNEETDRKYIQSITPDANGQVTVEYIIPAEENTSNTQYRLMAWYGDIDGNNNIQSTVLTPNDTTDVMNHKDNLATVDITLNSTTFKKVTTASGVWNAKQDVMSSNRVQVTNAANDARGENFVLTAKFKYDAQSKDIIENYWNNRATTPLTDDNIGRYFNWVMYGYNSRTGQSSTWLIRDKNVTGDSNSGLSNKIDFTVDLSLADDADTSGYATATITVTIPKDEFVYNNLDSQALYLFAWNDASNQFVGEYKGKVTNYKALMHTDNSGESPYSFLKQAGILDNSHFGNNYGGNGPGMKPLGPVASTYWWFQVAPKAVTQTDDTTGDATTPTQELDNSNKARQVLKSVTFKYDNSVPWDVQNNVDALGQQVLRVVAYKQNYPDSTQQENKGWSVIAQHNANGGVSSVSGYSLEVTHNEQDSTVTVTLIAANEKLAASYANYASKIKIVAYNTQNDFSGNTAGLLNSGVLNTKIGTTIPSNTTTITYKPEAMKSVGHGGQGDNLTGNIGHHTFTTSKKTGNTSTITYHFQMDNASWTNAGNQLNTEMQKKFDPEYDQGNVIVTLWKRVGGTGDFTFVDSYNGGTITPPSDDEDAITKVAPVTDNLMTKLEVQIQSGSNSNDDGTEYRVFAWYVISNGNGSWTKDRIQDNAFATGTPTVDGIIPYATATINMNFQDPDYYMEYPSLITLYDDQGNVKESGTGTDLSDQYAGAQAEVKYKPITGTVPEIQVDITDNMPMTAEGASAPSDRHTVGVYFTDGFKNVTTSQLNTGMIQLGTLSSTRTVPLDSNKGQGTQITPVGNSILFYLNTLQGNNGEKYTTLLTFHFNIVNSTSTP